MTNKEQKCWLCAQSQVIASNTEWKLPRVDLLYYAEQGGPAFAAMAQSEDNRNFTERFYIQYCPICGKKLNT